MNKQLINRFLIERARGLLANLRGSPRMYALTREGLLADVCGILSMVNPYFVSGEFYLKHKGTKGSSILGLNAPVRDAWGHAVIDDALALPFLQLVDEKAPEAFGCCGVCYNSHGECVEHGNCPCHTEQGRTVT